MTAPSTPIIPSSSCFTICLFGFFFFLQFSGKVQVFFNLFTFFYFHSVVRWNVKMQLISYFFLLIKTKSGLQTGICGSFVSQNSGEFHESHFALCIYHSVVWYLAQFFIDHLSQPVVPSLVLLLCKFAVFPYNMIKHFIPNFIQPTQAILLHIINFRFNVICLYDIILHSN